MSLKSLIERSQKPTVSITVTVPKSVRDNLDAACEALSLKRGEVLADAVTDRAAEMRDLWNKQQEEVA